MRYFWKYVDLWKSQCCHVDCYSAFRETIKSLAPSGVAGEMKDAKNGKRVGIRKGNMKLTAAACIGTGKTRAINYA